MVDTYDSCYMVYKIFMFFVMDMYIMFYFIVLKLLIGTFDYIHFVIWGTTKIVCIVFLSSTDFIDICISNIFYDI